MTAQLSRERLEAKIKHLEEVQRYRKNVQHVEIGFDLNADEKFQLEAYRMLLAGLGSEPLAYIIQDKTDRKEGRSGDLSFKSVSQYDPQDINEHELTATPLYAAPPAPVAVTDDVLKKLLPDVEKSDFWFEHDGKIFFEGVKFNNAVFDACRAAMLKAEPVTAATVPDGWKLVPVEPTEAMLDAAYSHPASTEDRMRKQYASMLAAAPTAPEQEV